MTDVADILLRILAAIETSNTGKRQKPPSMPRPLTARDRIEQVDALRRHQERVRLLLPDRRG